MKLTTALLAILLALPAALSAAVRPEFAELDTLPNTGTLVVPLRESGELPSVLDSTLKENLKNALDTADFKGKKDKSITLFAFDTYERVIVIGMDLERKFVAGIEEL